MLWKALALFVWLAVADDAEEIPKKEDKIVFGTPTTTDTYEWMVSIGARSWSYQITHFCGGSLIRNTNPALVLTAAHCIEAAAQYIYGGFYGQPVVIEVDIGRDDVDSNADPVYVTRNVIGWRYHRGYNSGTLVNDIGILILDSGVSGYDEINLQQYPNCCNTGDDCRVLGYGAWDDGMGLTDTFEYADVEYIDSLQCEKHFQLFYYFMYDGDPSTNPYNVDYMAIDWSQVSISYYYFIYPGMLCAYDHWADSCQGDSGGPLIKGTSASSKQIGIVSWGWGCGDQTPGVYADVGYYYNWITSASGCLLYDAGYNPTMDNGQKAYKNCQNLCNYEGGCTSSL